MVCLSPSTLFERPGDEVFEELVMGKHSISYGTTLTPAAIFDDFGAIAVLIECIRRNGIVSTGLRCSNRNGTARN